MAHISSRRRRALIAMSAVAGLTVAMSTPARAETVDLLCHYDNGFDLHVYLDTDRQSVVLEDDKRHGPFVTSISDTFIRFSVREEQGNDADWDYQYTIDRVAGTMRDLRFFRGAQKADMGGKCRRATQKF